MVSVSEITSPVVIEGVRTIEAPPLRKSFAWTLAGNLIYAACQWGMLSALAKMGSAAVVGQFALGLAITAPVFMLTNLQLRGVQATDAHSEYDFGHYFTLRLVASLLGIVVVGGIVLAGGYERTTSAVVLLVAAAKAVESISDVANGLQQKHERLDQVAIGLMLKGVISVTAFTAVYGMTHRLTSAVVALVCSWAAVALFYDLRLALRLEGNVRRFFSADWRRIWGLVVLSAPLGLVMAMISLHVNVPRYIIERYLGQRELGIFAALAYLITAASLVVNALGQSASPRLSRMFVLRDLDGFKALVQKLIAFGATLGIVAVPFSWLCGRQLITLIYGPEYADYLRMFLVMVTTASVTAVTSFLGYAMTAARCLRVQVPLNVSALVAAAIFTFVFVQTHGVTGAAVAVLLSAAIKATGSACVLARAIRKSELA